MADCTQDVSGMSTGNMKAVADSQQAGAMGADGAKQENGISVGIPSAPSAGLQPLRLRLIPRTLEIRDVDLDHGHHCGHSFLGLDWIGIAYHFHEKLWIDLP